VTPKTENPSQNNPEDTTITTVDLPGKGERVNQKTQF